MTAGANPVGIKKGIDKTCAFLVQKLAENAKPIRGTDDIRAVASISAGNDDEIGRMIAGAIEKARPRRAMRAARAAAAASPAVPDPKSALRVMKGAEGPLPTPSLPSC